MTKSFAKVELYCCRRVALLLLLSILSIQSFAQYKLNILSSDDNRLVDATALGIPDAFRNRALCEDYIRKMPALLLKKGFPVASIDSVAYDSSSASVYLYLGQKYVWAQINTDSVDDELLSAVSWDKSRFVDKPLNIAQVESTQRKILEHLENTGYPFARVELDNILITDQQFHAAMRVHKGPLYKVDSIRNMGNGRISSIFLQRYLGIMNGSLYRRERLEKINQKILELPYLTQKQPWDLTLLGTGSILNLYLDPQRSSQVNVLIGLMPSNQQLESNKMLITGEATVNLKNSLGNGETIALNWQQIQVKSPRLDIAFQQPYLFSSPFGASFNFNLFKKDSSFITISMLAGAQFELSSSRTGTLFIQSITSNLLSVDTFYVKNNRRLPEEVDLRSINIGVNYQWAATDYRFNPRKGTEMFVSTAVGTKNIRKNNVIGKLYDPNFNFNSLYDTMKLKSYQLRLRATAAHYISISKVSTLKGAVAAGWFESPSIFRNELFQIGGYRLLRGFDEESIFASQYLVSTIEYRYLIGQNSFLFAFVDHGLVRNRSIGRNLKNTFLGSGLGLAFETAAGILNISYAAGKRDDARFNLRQSKIHLGFVSYF